MVKKNYHYKNQQEEEKIKKCVGTQGNKILNTPLVDRIIACVIIIYKSKYIENVIVSKHKINISKQKIIFL